MPDHFRAGRAVAPFALFLLSALGCTSRSAPSAQFGPPADRASAFGAAPPAAPAEPGAPPAMSSPAPSLESAKSAADDKPLAKNDAPTTWKRSRVSPNATRLMVGEREELPLETLQAKVTIDGFRARVVLDYVYANDRDRQLEGNFQLRLPEEASPYFFAFGESAYKSPRPSPSRRRLPLHAPFHPRLRPSSRSSSRCRT